ncbi:MAG TPA: ABC transporter permease subunit [Stellaceae bacterium]|nr:ABC transporter permease subunit [Stellaceae bacterium]
MSFRLGGASRLAVKAGAVGLILPVLLLALWEALARFGVAPPNLLPAPLAVLRSLRGLAVTGELWTHIAITLLRVLEGFLLGTAVATLLGALTGYPPLWRRLLDRHAPGAAQHSSVAWVPLFVLWLGISEQPKVTLIALGAFFPVYVSTMTGIQQVDRKLVEVAQVHGCGGVQLGRRVLLLATLPAYITGLRSGLGLAWMFVVAAGIWARAKASVSC